MASAAEAIFARELLELRMTGGLFDAFEKWAAAAVSTVMRGQTPNVAGALMKGTVLSSIPDELRDTAAAYLADNLILDDAVDVLRDVREFAATEGMSKDATRRLLRQAVGVDKGVFVPLPQEVLAMSRVPQLVPVGAPHIPEHPAILAPDVPFAQTGVTYGTRLERTGRFLSTTMSGRLARIEAELTGQDLRWVTMGDHRVRDTHQGAQGQTVSYDEWFQVGGTPMEYPGDPAAPIDETINCRCVLTLVTPPERRYVQRYIPRPWLNAAVQAPTGPFPSPSPAAGPVGLFAAPNQARAPKGTPIGGQWIDTPGGILGELAAPIREGEGYHASKEFTDALDVIRGYRALPRYDERTAAEKAVDDALDVPKMFDGGDRDATKAQMQDALDQWKTTAPDDLRIGVRNYTQGDYWTINAKLRGQTEMRKHGTIDEMVPIDPVQTSYLDSSVDALRNQFAGNGFRTGDQVTAAYRGFDTRYAAGDWPIGAFKRDGGITSASMSVLTTTGFGKSFLVLVPPGTDYLLGNADEQEVMFAPGSVWERVDEHTMRVHPPNTPVTAAALTAAAVQDLPTGGEVGDNSERFTGFPVDMEDVGPNPSLTAAAPNQARAPKGTPIGGEWIDTPGALLKDLTPVTGGPIEAGSPEAAKALTDYDEYIDGLTSEEFRDTPIGASDVLHRAYKYTGYDKNEPTLVDEIAHGPDAMYRGTAPGWAYDESGAGHDVLAADITDQFRTGDHWAGKGIHGDGSYFARNAYDPDKAWVIGNNYAGDTDGAILRAQWKPTANVLTFHSDYDRQEWDRLNIDASGGANAAMNTGVAAAILGYDGIRVGQGGDAWYEVVLNRGALDVQRDDVPVNEDWF